MTQDKGGATGVVSLNQFRSTMQHPAMAQIEAYWDGLRNGRPVPLRAEVDPRGISKALEYAFILERIAPGLARFRLAGMHLNDLMGMEVRGMPITSFFVPDARAQISDALEHVFEEPARARLRLSAAPGIGKPEMTADLVLLPLKSDLGDVSRALGCLVSKGEAGRTPRRFSVEEADVTSVLRLTPAPLEQTAGERAPGFAEPRPVFQDRVDITADGGAEAEHASQGRPAGERPYLKLIHSKD